VSIEALRQPCRPTSRELFDVCAELSLELSVADSEMSEQSHDGETEMSVEQSTGSSTDQQASCVVNVSVETVDIERDVEVPISCELSGVDVELSVADNETTREHAELSAGLFYGCQTGCTRKMPARYR